MVQLMGMAWDHPRGYKPLIAASRQYKKLFPNVSIKWDIRSLKEFGDMPIESLIERYDLITIDHPYVGQADKNDLLLKLEEHLTSDVLDTLEKESLGGCFEAYRYNKHIYALPIDAAALVAAYRKDQIEEIGLSLPKNREELKSVYGKFPAGFSVAWALCPTDIWCTFLSLCAQNAGAGFTGDHQINSKVGSQVLDEIKFHLDFLHPESLNWNPIQILDKMGNEEEIIYSPYLFGYTNYSRAGYTKSLVNFSNSPLGAQKSISTILGGVGLAVSSLSQNPSAAANFVQFVAGADIQEGIFTHNGGQPANIKAWQNIENNRLCSNFFNDTISTLKNAYIRPQHPGWNHFQEHGSDLIHEGILKNRDSEKIMVDLNALYQSMSNEP